MEEFLKNNSSIKMEIEGKRSKYEFIKQVLLKTRYTKYNTLSKKEKIIIIKYLVKLVGYSKGHIKKLIQKLHKGLLVWNSSRNRNRFPIKYSPEDIQRLIETDVAHECLNGKTTKDILRRQFEVFGDNRFENISKFSFLIFTILEMETDNMEVVKLCISSTLKLFKQRLESEENLNLVENLVF